MKLQTYSDAGTAPETALRFLAAPTDVNWSGKVHGGTVMRWIDEAAYVCAVGWSRNECVAVYAGGVRFYQSLQIGSIVECRARLLHTGRTSMHISIHVRSGDPKTGKLDLTTHCLIVFVALDESRRPRPIRRWDPRSEEDLALEKHALQLIELRATPHHGPKRRSQSFAAGPPRSASDTRLRDGARRHISCRAAPDPIPRVTPRSDGPSGPP
jgi:acyl-CoA hydrolase